jgi:hypothetical protein
VIPSINLITNYIIEQYNNRTISLLIEELSSQSIIADQDIRFHFLFKVIPDKLYPNTRIWLEPLIDTFIFTKPIPYLERMTLIFKDPTNKIILNTDIWSGFYQASRVTGPQETRVIPSAGLNTGGIIFLNNITSVNRNFINGEKYIIKFTDVSSTYGKYPISLLTNPITELSPGQIAINWFLRPEGHIATYHTLTINSNTRPTIPPFELPIIPVGPSNSQLGPLMYDWYFGYFIIDNGIIQSYDGTYVSVGTNLDGDTPFLLKFNVINNRINFPIKFRTLLDVNTNRITPV